MHPHSVGTPAGYDFLGGSECRLRQDFAAQNAWTPLCGGEGKKKMRNLGTVQVPTEAFMAVLKLDSD